MRSMRDHAAVFGLLGQVEAVDDVLEEFLRLDAQRRLLLLRFQLGALAGADALALARDLPHARAELVAREIRPGDDDDGGEDRERRAERDDQSAGCR